MKEKLSVLVSVSAICLMCLASPAVIEGCRRGLLICWELILPSLFPFFLLSILLGKSGFASAAGAGLERWSRRLFGVGGEGATALLLGLTGGYPMGAAYLRELEKRGAVRPEEGGRLLRFCNNSGPAFLVGALGIGVFGSRRAGFLLWLSHALAAVTAGLLFRRREGAAASVPSRSGQAPFSFRAAFPEAGWRPVWAFCRPVCPWNRSSWRPCFWASSSLAAAWALCRVCPSAPKIWRWALCWWAGAGSRSSFRRSPSWPTAK